jgi:hypothetical protein
MGNASYGGKRSREPAEKLWRDLKKPLLIVKRVRCRFGRAMWRKLRPNGRWLVRLRTKEGPMTQNYVAHPIRPFARARSIKNAYCWPVKAESH